MVESGKLELGGGGNVVGVIWFSSGSILWSLLVSPCSVILPIKMIIRRVDQGCEVKSSQIG